MSKTSGFAGAIVVAAVLATPALAQTPVPERRPALTMSLQIAVSDHSGTGLEGMGIGVSGAASRRASTNPLIVLSTLAGAACPPAQRATVER